MERQSPREQYLRTLGIDTWVLRTLVAPALVAPATSAPAQVVPAAGVAQPVAMGEPAKSPVEHGDAAAAWSALRAEVAACTSCGLHSTRTQTVFGVGDVRAEWLVIGEAPGADEDRQGEPFVGRAGQLLNAMLLAIGSPRDTVYIANILKCRPPGNRDPKPEEVRCCLPFLQRQIGLLQPRLILAVGRIAAQNLLGVDTPLARLRGHVHRFGERSTPMVVTYHPAYLLRSPGDKRKAWDDLKFARATHRAIVAGAQ
jgi:DNA polymerase